jgi:hypothetical protein
MRGIARQRERSTDAIRQRSAFNVVCELTVNFGALPVANVGALPVPLHSIR